MPDNSKLVKSSIVTFDLPFMINLPNGPYDVVTEDVSATVQLSVLVVRSTCLAYRKG